jgi:hypothetical protein
MLFITGIGVPFLGELNFMVTAPKIGKKTVGYFFAEPVKSMSPLRL